MSRTTLFSTPHGSNLYGLATPTSDQDWYSVVSRLPHIYQIRPARFAKQTIRGLDDILTIDLSTWVLQCEKGVPQALEAMFSRSATHDLIGDFRRSYRVGSAAIPTYLRTIKGFSFKGEWDRKYRMHAARLALNANSILRYGRFNPTLNDTQIEIVLRLAGPDGQPEALSNTLTGMVFAR